VTSVIDSGQAKLNFYNPRTYTASLVEVPISTAACNQRKGRAGRTAPGYCYRLYKREDFENRSLFTLEEIYRTDLSEVLLRMAELGITDFEGFDFISKPPRSGIAGALDILNLLDALNPDRTLSSIGTMMCAFPLLPRLSRMIVEAITKYPTVLEEVIIAASFLSTMSPYILPAGQEMEARAAHHAFRDPNGDFVSYLRMFKSFRDSSNKPKFCDKSFLDERTMLEIARIKEQIELIVHDLGVPISSGGATEDYLCAVSRGLIQFVCAREERGQFRTLMAEKVQIHPGSVMFRENPDFIVAGEIVRTTRMYAMSVSPLQRRMLERISPLVAKTLLGKSERTIQSGPMAGRPDRRKASETISRTEREEARDFTNRVKLGSHIFPIEVDKKRKKAILDWDSFKLARESFTAETATAYKGMTGVIKVGGKLLLNGEKLETIIKVASWLNPPADLKREWPKKRQFSVHEELAALVSVMDHVLQVAYWKDKNPELGFVGLFNDGEGLYRFRVSRGFHTALNESLASLETLVDEITQAGSAEQKEKVGAVYRKLSGFFDE
ncbi:MAG TPA: oligonucleotide/oligosaccharide-binding fold domain-containing protein, partial [Spirochaetales bacterium]|nr:oligonucleotide/oligosaccharide-binding fold domain-containing protein [Spirochaetales bacterium]